MGAIGGGLRAFSGDPKYKVLRNVKNQKIDSLISSGLSDYESFVPDQKKATDAFAAAFEAETPGAQERTGQEVGVVDRVYSGGLASDLAGLRRQRFDARSKSVDLALKNARQQTNAARILRGGGNSSYAQKLGLDLANRVNAQALLEDADAARADYANVFNQQLGLMGRRSAMRDALAGRALVPQAQRQADFASRLGILGGLNELEKSNTFYGLQQEKSTAEKWAQLADALDQGIMNAASIAGSFMGGGMGGMGGGGGLKLPPNATGAYSGGIQGVGGGGGMAGMGSMGNWGMTLNPNVGRGEPTGGGGLGGMGSLGSLGMSL